MRKTPPPDLEFVDFARLIATGPAADVARILTSTPDLATIAAEIGATRQHASDFFLVDIRHYVYGGDTTLRRCGRVSSPDRRAADPHGADVGARNRRGAQPLHYASDGNHANPAPGATIGPSRRSVPTRTRSTARESPLCTSRPNPLPCGGTGAAERRRRSSAAECGGLEAAASCSSTHGTWRIWFGGGTSAARSDRAPAARAGREAYRSRRQRQRRDKAAVGDWVRRLLTTLPPSVAAAAARPGPWRLCSPAARS